MVLAIEFHHGGSAGCAPRLYWDDLCSSLEFHEGDVSSLQVLVGYVSLLRFTVDYFVLILEIDTKTKCISKLKGSQGYHNVWQSTCNLILYSLKPGNIKKVPGFLFHSTGGVDLTSWHVSVCPKVITSIFPIWGLQIIPESFQTPHIIHHWKVNDISNAKDRVCLWNGLSKVLLFSSSLHCLNSVLSLSSVSDMSPYYSRVIFKDSLMSYSYLKYWRVVLVVPLREMGGECCQLHTIRYGIYTFEL